MRRLKTSQKSLDFNLEKINVNNIICAARVSCLYSETFVHPTNHAIPTYYFFDNIT